MMRLDKVRNYSVRLVGQGGPEIVVEMAYLPVISSNRRLTRTRYGKTVLRSATQNWMDQLGFMVKAVVNSCRMSFKLPVKIVVAAEFPTRVYPDIHNLHKSIGDGVKLGLGIDDKFYIFEDEPVRVIKGCEKKVIVTIREA